MKTSKLSMLLMGILLALPFSSCSDDDDDEGGSSSNIVGSWQSTSDDEIDYYDPDNDDDEYYNPHFDDHLFIIFYKDGTWEAAESGESENADDGAVYNTGTSRLHRYNYGTWSEKNGTITMISGYRDEDSPEREDYTVTLNGSKLIIVEIEEYLENGSYEKYYQRIEYKKVSDSTSLWTFLNDWLE